MYADTQIGQILIESSTSNPTLDTKTRSMLLTANREHLYKRHREPKHKCQRCWEVFANSSELKDHHRIDNRCDRRPEPDFDGFGPDQENKLRSRKQSDLEGTEPEKWRKIFTVLFSHVPEEKIPSPCEFFIPPVDSMPHHRFLVAD